MLEKLQINIANWFEKISIKIKRRIKEKNLKSFLNKYNLEDSGKTIKKDLRFNPYEGTNILLVDELISSNVISKTDHIMDIGAGTGLFILYLAENGFNNLYGIEMDEILYKICVSNILKYKNISKNIPDVLEVRCENAINMSVNDEINCFYLFNTFYDMDTYSIWLENVKKSIDRKQRKVKIIILYPTVASMGAMRKCGWLQEKGRVVCKSQICHRCVNFIIYETSDYNKV